MPLATDDLAVDFFPQIGFATPRERAAAWAGFRAPAAALAQLSRGWGDEAEDRPSLHWSDEDAGWLATGSGPLGEVIGWLDFGGASLWIERREPQEGAWRELHGQTPRELMSWIRDSASRLSGAASAIGPEDLEATTADTRAVLEFEDTDARADLEAIYEGAGLLLSVLSDRLSGGAALPRVDPMTLEAFCDLTTSRGVVRGGVVRVGVEAPATPDGDGAWFVRDAAAKSQVRLSFGDLVHLQDGEAQHAMIATFVASAFASL